MHLYLKSRDLTLIAVGGVAGLLLGSSAILLGRTAQAPVPVQPVAETTNIATAPTKSWMLTYNGAVVDGTKFDSEVSCERQRQMNLTSVREQVGAFLNQRMTLSDRVAMQGEIAQANARLAEANATFCRQSSF